MKEPTLSNAGNGVGDPQDSERKPDSKTQIKALTFKAWIVTKERAANFLQPFQHMDSVGFFTAVLCFVSWLQWGALKKTDNTLHETLIASERPWISASAELTKDYIIGESGASFILDTRLENHGKSPAISVNPYSEMFVNDADANDVQGVAKRHCNMRLWPKGFGPSVFPNQTPERNLWAGLSRGQISDALHLERKPGTIYFGAHLLICIQYRNALSEDVSLTATLYHMSQDAVGEPPNLILVGTYAD